MNNFHRVINTNDKQQTQIYLDRELPGVDKRFSNDFLIYIFKLYKWFFSQQIGTKGEWEYGDVCAAAP